MIQELFDIIESDELAGHFYVAADTTGLLIQWISSIPAVEALEELAYEDPGVLTQIACRCLGFFSEAPEPGTRSLWEPAICCYAYVLTVFRKWEDARETIKQIERDANASHGALRRLMNRCLATEATAQRLLEDYLIPEGGIAVAASRVQFNWVANDAVPTGTWAETIEEYPAWLLRRAA